MGRCLLLCVAALAAIGTLDTSEARGITSRLQVQVSALNIENTIKVESSHTAQLPVPSSVVEHFSVGARRVNTKPRKVPAVSVLSTMDSFR